jgi:hypothetical protein
MIKNTVEHPLFVKSKISGTRTVTDHKFDDIFLVYMLQHYFCTDCSKHIVS